MGHSRSGKISYDHPELLPQRSRRGDCLWHHTAFNFWLGEALDRRGGAIWSSQCGSRPHRWVLIGLITTESIKEMKISWYAVSPKEYWEFDYNSLWMRKSLFSWQFLHRLLWKRSPVMWLRSSKGLFTQMFSGWIMNVFPNSPPKLVWCISHCVNKWMLLGE